MKEDLRSQIRWLEQELLSEELLEETEEPEPEFEEDELGPGYNYAADFGRAMYADEDYGIPQEEKPKKNSSTRGLRYLLLLEILGILALIGWWVRWLI